MIDKELKIEKLKKDIQEISEILDDFDRQKAEDIIYKHNTTDEAIGTFNSSLNPNSVPFYRLSDYAIKNNLCAIRTYLQIQLTKEQGNG